MEYANKNVAELVRLAREGDPEGYEAVLERMRREDPVALARVQELAEWDDESADCDVLFMGHNCQPGAPMEVLEALEAKLALVP